MARTSISHPLKVDEVGCAAGVVGMTFCPGKKGPSVYGQPWDRDLGLDLAAVAAWKPDAIVTLMEAHEFGELGVPGLPAQLGSLGPLWLHLPIRDVDVPDARFEKVWAYSGHVLRKRLRAGGRILVHCRGGLGRTGLLAGRLLVEFGANPVEAMALVRRARPGAIETPKQAAYVASCQPVIEDPGFVDRTFGCLLGGAVGDAFGYEVEFDTWRQIQARHGARGLVTPVLQDGKLVVSDDTQMTLFTAEGLASAVGPDLALEAGRIVPAVRQAYLAWLQTQGRLGAGPALKGLAGYPELWRRRAPGNTCLSALQAGGDGTPSAPINNSKGCGGVMRVAPLGLLPALSADESFGLADEAAALTHGHPCGRLSAAAMASLVRDLMHGASFGEALGAAIQRLRARPDGGETVAALLKARALARQDIPAPEAIHQLGGGWVGEEALAIAVYAVLKGEGFMDVVRIAANHDGDSDSTASIAGQLWGALHGLGDELDAWALRLDVLEPLCDIAGQLVSIVEAEAVPRLSERLSVLARYVDVHSIGSLPGSDLEADPFQPLRTFLDELVAAVWLRPFDWPTWQVSDECGRLLDGPLGLQAASHVQLARLLTMLARKDRFCEGVLEWGFKSGIVSAAAHRAKAILAELPAPSAPLSGGR